MIKFLKLHVVPAILVIVGSLILPTLAYAQSAPSTSTGQSGGMDAITMLINLSRTYPDIISMLTGGCFVIGFVLALQGVYYLRAYGDLRTMTSSQTSLRTPVTLFIVSAVFMYIPNAFHTLITTAFGYSSPLQYDQSSSSIDPVILKALVGLIQVIGLIAFIRGWMVLVAHAKQPGGHATLGKGLTHIIGGIFAINIIGVTDVIWNTFGFQF
jgi:intracellular multiplication protein IcmC